MKIQKTQENLLPLPNYLKELRGPGPENVLLSEITFYMNNPSVWQGKHLITKHLFFWLYCELPSFPLKFLALSHSLDQDGLIRLKCHLVLASHISQGSWMYKNEVVFLLLIVMPI